MTRGLGTALALSVVAHGGAVATVGVLGAAWLAGPSPVPPPAALFMDLVQPVVLTRDRIVAADASPLHLRTTRPARSETPGIPVAAPRAPLDPARAAAVPPVVAGDPVARPDTGASITPDVPRPPTAPVAPEPSGVRAESPPPRAADVRAQPVEPAAPLILVPATVLTPAAPESPAREVAASPPRAPVAGPGPAASSSPPPGSAPGAPVVRPSPGAESREPTASGAGRETAVPSGARSPGDGPAVGSRSPDSPGASGLARLTPGEAQASGAHDGATPPEYESYVRALRQRIQDRLVYPWTAVRRGQQGIVELEVHLGPEGRLVGVEVVAGPRAETLRAAAVTAVRGAAPFPFPPGIGGRPLVIRLPVEFRLR